MRNEIIDLSYLHEFHADEKCGCGNVGVGPDGYCAECLAPDAYLVGVERAAERDSVRQARIKATLDAFVGFGVDHDAAKAAKERSDARKAKYPPTETWVRFLPVPRGSRPLTSWEIESAMRNAVTTDTEGVDEA